MIELTERAKEYLKKVGKPNVSLTCLLYTSDAADE